MDCKWVSFWTRKNAVLEIVLFFNFTAPLTGDIIFEIDGEVIAPVLGTEYSTVRDSVAVTENTEQIYKDGTSLAPFDKEVSDRFKVLL